MDQVDAIASVEGVDPVDERVVQSMWRRGAMLWRMVWRR